MRINKNKSFVEYGTVFSFDVINKLIAGLCTIIIIRILTTSAYAEYTLFNSIASIVTSMIGSGITTGFLRMSVKNRSMGKDTDGGYYTVSFFVVIVFSFMLFLIRGVFESIYSTNGLLVAFSIIEAAILSLCQLNVYVFQAREQYARAGRIYNLRNIMIFLFLIIIYFWGFNNEVTFIIIGTLIAGLASVLLSFLFFRKLKDFRFPSFHVSKEEIKTLFFEIRWLIFYFAILAMINALDIIVLNRYTDSYNVANYGVAFKYYTLLLSMLPSISAILRVKSSTKEYEVSAKKRLEFIKNWLKKMGLLSVVVISIIPVISYFVWEIINGVEYRLAYYCFVIFIFGAMLSYMFSPMVNFVLAANLHKRLCCVAFFALVFNVVGNYYLVHHFEAIGVSATTVISQAIINIGGTIILLHNDKKEK